MDIPLIYAWIDKCDRIGQSVKCMHLFNIEIPNQLEPMMKSGIGCLQVKNYAKSSEVVRRTCSKSHVKLFLSLYKTQVKII